MILSRDDLDRDWLQMFRNCKDTEAAKLKYWLCFQKNRMMNMSGLNRTFMNR